MAGLSQPDRLGFTVGRGNEFAYCHVGSKLVTMHAFLRVIMNDLNVLVLFVQITALARDHLLSTASHVGLQGDDTRRFRTKLRCHVGQ